MSVAVAGSSPRGRGTLQVGLDPAPPLRFIPAWAGNTSTAACRPDRPPVHPRVGGEHRTILAGGILLGGSSPRGRGTHAFAPPGAVHGRFIPAWAGNTPIRPGPARSATLHPRVGGEHTLDAKTPRLADGSSPRWRGTQFRVDLLLERFRFIPAWAGNTPVPDAGNRSSAVHPRVGGEHSRCVASIRAMAGSSPRGRGTLFSQPFDSGRLLRR